MILLFIILASLASGELTVMAAVMAAGEYYL